MHVRGGGMGKVLDQAYTMGMSEDTHMNNSWETWKSLRKKHKCITIFKPKNKFGAFLPPFKDRESLAGQALKQRRRACGLDIFSPNFA